MLLIYRLCGLNEVRGNFERDLAAVHLNAASKSGEFDALVRQIAAGVAPDRRQQRKALWIKSRPRLRRWASTLKSRGSS